MRFPRRLQAGLGGMLVETRRLTWQPARDSACRRCPLPRLGVSRETFGPPTLGSVSNCFDNAVIAHKAERRLEVSLDVAGLTRSTFFYHQSRLQGPDPPASLKAAITGFSTTAMGADGYTLSCASKDRSSPRKPS